MMSFDSWLVAAALIAALAFLVRHTYRHYQKEARQMRACQSCPLVKQRQDPSRPIPPPPLR